MNRRSFIKYASLAASGSVAGLTQFGRMSALAQSVQTTDYKALVCIFLGGGNDSNNMIVPLESDNYSLYAIARGSLSIAHSSLLPMTNTPFGIHPSMTDMQGAFNSSALAVVANVGPLVQPTTVSQYKGGTAILPQSLMSHSDQANNWQAASGAATGWGGGIADLLTSRNGSGKLPMSISLAGLSVFSSGVSTSPFVSPGPGAKIWCAEGNLCDARFRAAQQMLQFDSGATLVQADNQRTSKMYSYLDIFADAIGQVPQLHTQFPPSSLGSQLQQIAQVIQARGALGANRQIFFAQLGPFDTHSNQILLQANLLAELSSAMGAFRAAMIELGTDSEVTSFTMSEFSRAMVGNVSMGSDHAWGGHQLVMGGAVKGGMFGTFPSLVLGGPDDIDIDGRWLPTSSVVQYGASLASWFGVSTADLNTIFPLLNNFTNPNLGFI